MNKQRPAQLAVGASWANQERGLMVTPERKTQEFWAIDDDGLRIVQAIGYECPSYTDLWWVPSLGASLTRGVDIFATYTEARNHAQKQWSDEANRYLAAIRRLGLIPDVTR